MSEWRSDLDCTMWLLYTIHGLPLLIQVCFGSSWWYRDIVWQWRESCSPYRYWKFHISSSLPPTINTDLLVLVADSSNMQFYCLFLSRIPPGKTSYVTFYPVCQHDIHLMNGICCLWNGSNGFLCLQAILLKGIEILPCFVCPLLFLSWWIICNGCMSTVCALNPKMMAIFTIYLTRFLISRNLRSPHRSDYLCWCQVISRCVFLIKAMHTVHTLQIL